MKLLMELYRISSPSGKEQRMIKFICAELTRLNVNYTVDKHGNIYAVKGESESYPCLAAHTDEVHGKHKKGFEVVNFRDEIIFGYDTVKHEYRGIGADDKNGIWVCLKCLETTDVLKCVFFTGEETGCQGSSRADMSFFDDCRFVIQCDRKGSGDFIRRIGWTDLCSDAFIRAVDPGRFGYRCTDGLQTDVLALKTRGLEVSCANISCGYYNPHTDEEFTKIADLQNCLSFVRHIVRECTDIYPHTSVKSTGRHPYHSRDFFGMNDHFRYHRSRLPRRQSPDYHCLVEDINSKLFFDGSLTVNDLMKELGGIYPLLDRSDFEIAYADATGMI